MEFFTGGSLELLNRALKDKANAVRLTQLLEERKKALQDTIPEEAPKPLGDVPPGEPPREDERIKRTLDEVFIPGVGEGKPAEFTERNITLEDTFLDKHTTPQGFIKEGMSKYEGTIHETADFRLLMKSENLESELKNYMPPEQHASIVEKSNGDIKRYLFSPEGRGDKNYLQSVSLMREDIASEPFELEINANPNMKTLIDKLQKFDGKTEGFSLADNYVIKTNRKYIDGVREDRQPLAYMIDTFLYTEEQTTDALEILRGGTDQQVDELIGHIAHAMLIDGRNGLARTPLSATMVAQLIGHLGESAEKELLSGIKYSHLNGLNLTALLSKEKRTFDIPELLDETFEMPVLPGSIDYVAPEMVHFTAKVLNIPLAKVTISRAVTACLEYFGRIDLIERASGREVINRFHSSFTELVEHLHKTEKISRESARIKSDNLLEYLDGSNDLSTANLDSTSMKIVNSLKQIKRDLDFRSDSVLRSKGGSNISFYVRQLFASKEFISSFDELRESAGDRGAVLEMANKVYEKLDIYKTTREYYKRALNDLNNKTQEYKDLQKELNEFTRENMLEVGKFKTIKVIDADVISGTIQDILKVVGRGSGYTSKKLQSVRLFHYENLKGLMDLHRDFGFKGTSLEVLVDTMKYQLDQIKEQKYFTFNGDGDLYASMLKLNPLIRANQENLPPAQRYLLIGRNRILASMIGYSRGENIASPRAEHPSWYNKLSSLFYTTALGKMIFTSTINDSIGLSFWASSSLKESMLNFQTYMKGLTNNLNKDEINIMGGIFQDVSSAPMTFSKSDLSTRRYGDALFSNSQLAYSGKSIAQLVINRKVAHAVLRGVPDDFIKNMNNWFGDHSMTWFDHLVKNKDTLITQGEHPYVDIGLIDDYDVRSSLSARIMGFSDIPIPEYNHYTRALKHAVSDLPFIFDMAANSLLMFKSPSLVESTTSYRMFSNQIRGLEEMRTNFFVMSMFQSFVFQYLSAKGKGQDISKEKWFNFITSVILNSPVTGAFGQIIDPIVHGDAYQLLSSNYTSPVVPIIKGASGAIGGLFEGSLGKMLYYLAKNANSYSGFKNFPIISAIWNKHLMAHLYDWLYPKNRYKQSQETFAKAQGLTYNFEDN